jgi:hypothetical protein
MYLEHEQYSHLVVLKFGGNWGALAEAFLGGGVLKLVGYCQGPYSKGSVAMQNLMQVLVRTENCRMFPEAQEAGSLVKVQECPGDVVH